MSTSTGSSISPVPVYNSQISVGRTLGGAIVWTRISQKTKANNDASGEVTRRMKGEYLSEEIDLETCNLQHAHKARSQRITFKVKAEDIQLEASLKPLLESFSQKWEEASRRKTSVEVILGLVIEGYIPLVETDQEGNPVSENKSTDQAIIDGLKAQKASLAAQVASNPTKQPTSPLSPKKVEEDVEAPDTPTQPMPPASASSLGGGSVAGDAGRQVSSAAADAEEDSPAWWLARLAEVQANHKSVVNRDA